MQTIEHNRRANDAGERASAAAPAAGSTDTVRHGILLQRAASTVAAVEYLSARGVDAAVIRRVMAGKALREGDRAALALQERTPAQPAPQ